MNPTVDKERRQHERYPVRMTVALTRGRTTTAAEALEISINGLFVRTESTPPLRELIRLELTLPHGDRLQLHGMAVHAELPGDAGRRPAGVDIQLFGVAPRTRARWDKLDYQVRSQASTQPLGTPTSGPPLPTAASSSEDNFQNVDASESIDIDFDEPLPADPAVDPASIAREALALASAMPAARLEEALSLAALDDGLPDPEANTSEESATDSSEPLPGVHVFDAYKPELRLRLVDEEEFRRLRLQDFRSVPMFIRTAIHLDTGTSVCIRVVDPSVESSLSVMGVVERRLQREDFAGLSVRLLGLDHNGRIPLSDESTRDVFVTIDLEPGAIANLDLDQPLAPPTRFRPPPHPSTSGPARVSPLDSA